MFRRVLALPVIGLVLVLAACTGPAAADTPASPAGARTVSAADPTDATLPTPAAVPATASSGSTMATPAPAASPSADATLKTAAAAAATAATAPSSSAPAVSGAIHLVTAPTGTDASYRVREQLAGRSFPNDAVGTTSNVTGTIAIQPDGTLMSGQSRFVVDLSTLTSDERMRDNYLRRNTLSTAQYPSAIFVPTAIKGLQSPLPASGDVKFQVVGDLTLHGSTHPITWDATGHVSGQDLTGSATTTTNFESLGLTQPRVSIVLSVQDQIVLTIDYHMTLSQ